MRVNILIFKKLVTFKPLGGLVVKNPSAKAGDMGSIPDPGRSLHTTRQLSMCTTATEPVLKSLGPRLLSPHAATTKACVSQSSAPNKRRHHSEKPVHNWRVALSHCNYRKVCTARKTQNK